MRQESWMEALREAVENVPPHELDKAMATIRRAADYRRLIKAQNDIILIIHDLNGVDLGEISDNRYLMSHWRQAQEMLGSLKHDLGQRLKEAQEADDTLAGVTRTSVEIVEE